MYLHPSNQRINVWTRLTVFYATKKTFIVYIYIHINFYQKADLCWKQSWTWKSCVKLVKHWIVFSPFTHSWDYFMTETALLVEVLKFGFEMDEKVGKQNKNLSMSETHLTSNGIASTTWGIFTALCLGSFWALWACFILLVMLEFLDT